MPIGREGARAGAPGTVGLRRRDGWGSGCACALGLLGACRARAAPNVGRFPPRDNGSFLSAPAERCSYGAPIAGISVCPS